MNKRDAINEILLALNEQPLDAADAVEDIQIAVVVDKQLDITKRKILSRGWYFNTIVMDLIPNTNGYIVIPSTFLSVDGVTNSNVTVRDWKLFDKSELTYKFTEPESCEVIDDIPFDDVPQLVADYIVQTASLQAYINIIGNTDDINVRREELQRARIEALREDARNTGGNRLSDANSTDILDRVSK